MNEVNQKLLELAKKIALPYIANPKVLSISINGSVAREQADVYSDIDMSIYYSEFPTKEEIDKAHQINNISHYKFILAPGKQTYAEHQEFGAIIEQFWSNGTKFDLVHSTTNYIESVIEENIISCDPNSPMLKILAGIDEALPIHGFEYIEKLQALVRNYPKNLAIAMVENNLNFRPLWIIERQGVERNDIPFFLDEILIVAKHIVGILVGLNYLYYPVNSVEFKRTNYWIEKMIIAPKNFAFRFKQLFYEEPSIVLNIIKKLIEDTL
ncbi:MAG: nucleotidyltransferase domain-containing protein, partial [Cyanobacteria bacterium P01_E01_bin.35]